ncbi:MAG: hypothetical protein JKY08_03735 [Flavobacteriaceae bacterium]|nr:hypothetical protein [Flavobacteriaceae bacterium]
MNNIEPLIVIGVVIEDRWNQFLTPNNHKETLKIYQPPIVSANKLLMHIETEIEPYLKKNFRTEGYRLTIGHSLVRTFLTYPSFESDHLFDYSIIISPNYSYDKEQFVERANKYVTSDL